MKKLIQQLALDTANGNRTLPDGSYVSDRRLETIERVAELVGEIPPGPSSEAKISKMVSKWKEQFSPNTIKLYLEVCKQATAGQEYVWPKVKREEKEPTPLPADVALKIIQDLLPSGFDKKYDLDCFTACKLAINSCLRPIDAVNVRIENIGDGEAIIRHRKTKKQVRSKIHPDLQAWLADVEERLGDVFSSGWYSLNESYRKRMLKSFLLRLLSHYGVADKVIVGVDAGSVSRKKLKEVITAKSLRSTGANLLLSMGVPAHNVMAIGGWSNWDIFQRHYLKPNIDVWKL